jgi:hypothetical protein
MAPAGTIIEKPNFPEHFPEERKAQWHKAFNDGLEQAKVDSPDGAFLHQTARREANRLMRIPVPKSHADAMKMERWQYLERKTIGADRIAALGYEPQGPGEHVVLVTIDGKKYFFAAPAGQAKAAEAAKDADKK